METERWLSWGCSIFAFWISLALTIEVSPWFGVVIVLAVIGLLVFGNPTAPDGG